MSFSYNQFMPNLYSTEKDLDDRLNGCIVRYDGVPHRVFIEGTQIGLKSVVKGSRSPVKYIKADDPLLDISIMECFYCNHVTKEGVYRTFWMTRGTGKTYKSATYPHHSNMLRIDGSTEPNIFFETVWSTKEAEESMMGLYPSVGHVLTELFPADGGVEVAIDQRVALRKERIGLIKIHVEGYFVGWMDPEDKKVKITNDDRRWAIERVLEPTGLLNL